MTTETIAPAPAAPAQGAPAPAPAAPAPAPAEPVAITPPAPAPAEPAPAPATPEAVTYEPTGDPGLDLAYGFIGKLGIKGDDPAVAAAKAGDFAQIKAKLASLGDKAAGWEQHVALAEQSYSRAAAASKTQAEAVANLVYGTVGNGDATKGKETWAKVQAWASENATEDEAKQLNAAFAAGGIAAKSAAQYLHNLWQRKSGQAEHKPAAKPDAGAAPADATGPLSAKDYTKALDALRLSAKGRDISGLPAYRELQQRRLAGRKAGI